MKKRPFAELSGTGSYAPPRVMTNDEFSKILDTSDQWIRERTGIRERRVSSKEESNACMGKAAALQVLEQNGLTPLDLDAIVYATASPDRLLPSQACDLQAILGAKNAAAFDVGAACSGFVYALNVAEGLVASEQAEKVLVVAAEKLAVIERRHLVEALGRKGLALDGDDGVRRDARALAREPADAAASSPVT